MLKSALPLPAVSIMQISSKAAGTFSIGSEQKGNNSGYWGE